MENILEKDEIDQVINILAQMFPESETELDYESDLDLLIATLLSAQTTDVQVNKATKKLFPLCRTPQDYIDLGQEGLADKIKTIGFYNVKSKHVIGLCEKLITDFGSRVPKTREELMTLPGVGRKTANVVISNLFGQPAIAVDTHVFRTSNRLGLADADTVEKTEEMLMEVLPRHTWTEMHHRLIFLGRRICKARRPLCEECDLNHLCKWFNKGGIQ